MEKNINNNNIKTQRRRTGVNVYIQYTHTTGRARSLINYPIISPRPVRFPEGLVLKGYVHNNDVYIIYTIVYVYTRSTTRIAGPEYPIAQCFPKWTISPPRGRYSYLGGQSQLRA